MKSSISARFSSPSALIAGAAVSFNSSSNSTDSLAKLLTKLSGFLISWAMPSKTNSNALSGIMLRQQSQVIDSEASGNGGDGIDLALTPDGVAVAGSTALRNGGAGITLLCPGSAVSNTAKFNGAGNLVEMPGVIGPPVPACVNFDNTAP